MSGARGRVSGVRFLICDLRFVIGDCQAPGLSCKSAQTGHSRESGNPAPSVSEVDPRLRGGDDLAFKPYALARLTPETWPLLLPLTPGTWQSPITNRKSQIRNLTPETWRLFSPRHPAQIKLEELLGIGAHSHCIVRGLAFDDPSESSRINLDGQLLSLA